MNTPTEEEIKRAIHSRLDFIVTRARQELMLAAIERAKAEVALSTARAYDDGYGNLDYSTIPEERQLERAEEKENRQDKVLSYWIAVRDWADEKLIGPLTEPLEGL